MNDTYEVRDLPLQPSERRHLNDLIKEANARYETVFGAAMRKCTGIINNDQSLTPTQKENIINALWK